MPWPNCSMPSNGGKATDQVWISPGLGPKSVEMGMEACSASFGPSLLLSSLPGDEAWGEGDAALLVIAPSSPRCSLRRACRSSFPNHELSVQD